MTTAKYYPLIGQVNGRSSLNCAYPHQSNYQLLYLLALTQGVCLAPSRSALIKYNAIPLSVVRQLTNRALDRFLRGGQLVIDTKLFVNAVSLGVYNLDVPNKTEDCAISYDVSMATRAR